MKKYYMAIVDFSEIDNITADEVHLEKSRARLMEHGLLTDKGNPSPSNIKRMTENVSAPFFDKLKLRISRRPGGIAAVKNTFQKLYDNREYVGIYMYLCFLYGFMEWQVPERIQMLPAAPDALKIFASDFLSAFEKYIAKLEAENKEELPIDTEKHNEEKDK